MAVVAVPLSWPSAVAGRRSDLARSGVRERIPGREALAPLLSRGVGAAEPPGDAVAVPIHRQVATPDRHELARAVVSYTLVVAVASSAWSFLRERSLPWGESPAKSAVKEAAAYLERLTTPEMPVPICVWNDWAELYWRTPRPSVTICIAPTLFNEIHPRAFDEWVKAMLAQKPPLLVTDRWMLGPTSESLLHLGVPGFPQLKEMVDRDYVVIHRIRDLCFLAVRGGSFDHRTGKVQ